MSLVTYTSKILCSTYLATKSTQFATNTKMMLFAKDLEPSTGGAMAGTSRFAWKKITMTANATGNVSSSRTK